MMIPNMYDEDLITDKVKRLANKVVLSFEPANTLGDIGEKNMLNKNFTDEMAHWRVTLTFQGKDMRFLYAVSKDQGDKPRIEYILSSMFATARLYDAFKDDPAEFYIRYNPMFTNFKASMEYMEQIKSSYEELKGLFGDKYAQYKQAFTSFNPLFDMIDADKGIN